MGGGSWDRVTRSTYSSNSVMMSKSSRAEIFSNRSIDDRFDPSKFSIRESVDSDDNPNSTPIICALDVTGSMGLVPEHMIREGLGVLASNLIDRAPVSDPHIMMMAIGDARSDRAPIQATQFEADIRISEQLRDLYLEGNGGGNATESYDYAWLFASRRTKIDSYDKRGVKGYLFTIGDENPPESIPKESAVKWGFGTQEDIMSSDSLSEAQDKWHVFHLCVEEVGHRGCYGAWKNVLGDRAIRLSNYKKVSEVITSVIQVSEGQNADNVINQWEDDVTRNVVRRALGLD